MLTTYVSLLANKLGKVDTTFFLIVLGAIVVCVGIYFLIPVFNRRQYREARENLQKREEAFRSNRFPKETAGETKAEENPEQKDDNA